MAPLKAVHNLLSQTARQEGKPPSVCVWLWNRHTGPCHPHPSSMRWMSACVIHIEEATHAVSGFAGHEARTPAPTMLGWLSVFCLHS